MISRREAMSSGAAALALAGCAKPCPPLSLPQARAAAPLLDAHCHTFNIKDLSAVRFVSWVVLEHYPEVASLAFRPEDPTWLDHLVKAVLDVVGAWAAPTADYEHALLTRQPQLPRAGEDREPVPPAAQRAQTVERLTDLLEGRSLRDDNAAGEELLRRMTLGSAGAAAAPRSRAELRALAESALSENEAKDAAAMAAAGLPQIYLPGLFEFAGQLRRFRHCEVDTLATIHRNAGQEPLLMAPAMVDFGRWLRDDPEAGSSFVEQAKVWEAISRRPGGPAVHGYVAFCPLRQVQFDMGRLGSGRGQIPTACDDDPFEVVRTALTEQGFLGVKLYPPMGFRAADNASRRRDNYPMPMDVLTDVFGHAPRNDAERDSMTADLGERLDRALDRIYALCFELQAPIMAHGGNSVGANRGYGELADPYFWKPVLERRDAPKVMLAHFGGFAYQSADPAAPRRPEGQQVPWEATWEAWIGRFLQARADAPPPLWTDISYLTEAQQNHGAALADFQRLSTAGMTRLRERLVFGTDWVMLAREKGVKRYSSDVRAFLAEAFPNDVEAIMRRNFLAYADLAPNSETFRRIARVYRGDVGLTARLELACRI